MAVAGAMLLGGVPVARAATSLTLSTDDGLTLLGQTITVTVHGPFGSDLRNITAVATMNGPGRPSVVGHAWPEAASVHQDLGDLSGRDSFTLTVPENAPSEPGGYLITVELHDSGAAGAGVDPTVLASGQLWVGKVSSSQSPVDVAFVWPAILGIHRDPSGVFFDQTLEQAVDPAAQGAGSLYALFNVAHEFPQWHFTLGVEPVLLAQLGSMASGYTRLDASGNKLEVKPGDAAAQNAGKALTVFKAVANLSNVEIDAAPYAGPSLGMLAKEGWRDGFLQVQLGKQQIQDSLGLASAPTGGYPADLDVTTDSLASFALASIDYAVVDQSVESDLTEPLPEGAVTARARDQQNNRLTLAFASSELRTDITPPWDVDVFFAGLAASLAAGQGGALVIAPGGDYTIPPVAYLRAIGAALARLTSVSTVTLGDLVKAHSPGTRPIFLNRFTGQAAGYVGQTLLEGLRAAHQSVSDLAESSDATRSPVDNAQLLLYAGESGCWFTPDVAPRVASIGLAYSDAAGKLAAGELAKVTLGSVAPTRVWGSGAELRVSVENGAGYPLKAVLAVEGPGLSFPSGARFEKELAAGESVVAVAVKSQSGSATAKLTATLTVGSTLVATKVTSVRFVTLATLLPWIAIAAVVIVAAVLMLLLRRRRRKRRRKP